MGLKFPSGKVSVSIRDLQGNQQSQSTCGICDKPWVIESHGCTMRQLHVLHPCQHLVGSGCWSSVPDEHKDKCPVCKVEIRCDEKVRVYKAVERFVPGVQESETQMSGLEDDVEDIQAQATIVENKLKEGLNDVDVRAIMYYMNLRARLDSIKGSLDTLLASTKTLTPTHRERLISFLANTPYHNHDTKRRQVEVALSALNISGGTSFTMNDLRKILGSTEGWIQKHFAAILEDDGKAAKQTSNIRELEKKLEKAAKEDPAKRELEKQIADLQAELTALENRQTHERAQQLEFEIKLAIDEIEKKAIDDIGRVRAEAAEEVADIYAAVKDETIKIRGKAMEEITELRSHGKVMKE
ncbi:MAG: hypothetical protein ASARMPREDX12_002381 [Alectoria sarmentosa]|nr:MAG: hypothetical protein ASARMPREDX12_002381 [Alectoria sarmentosa]